MSKKVRRILLWIFFLFLVYIIFELARKILGGSLGYNEVITALLVINVGFSFHLSQKISGHIGWHKGRGD